MKQETLWMDMIKNNKQLLYNVYNHIVDKTQSFSNYQEKGFDKYIHHNRAHIDSTDAKNCPTVTVNKWHLDWW